MNDLTTPQQRQEKCCRQCGHPNDSHDIYMGPGDNMDVTGFCLEENCDCEVVIGLVVDS